MVGRWLDMRWARVAAVFGAASIVLGWLAAQFDTFPLDESTSRRINRWGDWYEPIGTLTNDHVILLAFVAALLAMGMLAARGSWSGALLFPLVATLRVLLSELKAMVGRPRPADLDIRDLVGGRRFPAGT